MPSSTILSATETLDQFIVHLDAVYWEAAVMEHKDVVFNVSRVLTKELMELHKVSIQDGDYEYEPVSEDLRSILPQLAWLSDHLPRITRRTPTQAEVQPLIRLVQQLIS